MFERFTEASRAVLVEAQDVAVELGSGHLGVGHVFYGCAEVRDETAGRPLRDAGVTGSLVRQVLPRAHEAASDPVDPDALKALGVDYEQIRDSIENVFGKGALEEAPDRRTATKVRKPRFTPEAVESLKLSLVAARELKARRLQPGHLLLGVLRTEDEAVSRTLTRAGITAAELEATIVERLSVTD